MKVLILEDEAPAFRRLQNLLNENYQDIEIIEVIDTVEHALKWMKNHTSPDLIFSDIQLSDGLSFEIYKNLPPSCPIIFTTAYDEYMFDAFKTNGIDYLLKPIQSEELKRSIEKYKALSSNPSQQADINSLIKAMSTREKKFKERFLVKIGTKLLPIEINEIAYFSYSEGSTEIRTKANKKYLIDHSLDILEDMIDPNKFFRLNRQYLVNIDSIDKIHQYFKGRLKIDLIPESTEEVTVSREKASSFKAWMNGEDI